METKSKVQIVTEELVQFFNEFEFKYSCASKERLNQIEDILLNLNDSESEKICDLFDGIKRNFKSVDSFIDRKLDELKENRMKIERKIESISINDNGLTCVITEELEEIQLYNNHSVFVCRNGNTGLVEPSDLSVGDIIVSLNSVE